MPAGREILHAEGLVTVGEQSGAGVRDRVSAGQRIQDGHCQKVEQRSTYEFQGATACHGARCWRARWRKRKGASKKPDEAEEHGRDDAGRREDEPHDIAHRDRLSLLGRSRVRVCPRSTRVPGCLGAFGRSRALRCSEVLWCGALLGCRALAIAKQLLEEAKAALTLLRRRDAGTHEHSQQREPDHPLRKAGHWRYGMPLVESPNIL